MNDYTEIDWFRTLSLIHLDHYEIGTGGFDKFMLDRWDVKIIRNHASMWEEITAVEVDERVATLLILAYPRSIAYHGIAREWRDI